MSSVSDANHQMFGQSRLGSPARSLREMARVYIHEFVDVIGTERTRYQHHMTANWCPEAGPLRRQQCFGVFSVVGSTGRWPQVVNLWEYASWDDLGHNFGVELADTSHRDPMLAQWWARAAQFRTGGLDRILVAHDDSPDVDEWCARGGTGAVGYLHEILRVDAGAAPQVCDEVVAAAASRRAELGLELVGAFRTAMRADDEVITLTAVPDWSAWARAEAAFDAATPGAPHREVVRSRERILLVDAEFSPLRIGRQPAETDRRPLDEV